MTDFGPKSTHRNLSIDELSNVALPFPLRNYQKDGVEFLVQRSAALLADEMGLGKTIQVIVAIRLLLEHDVSARALIVSPRALVKNWLREFSVWAPTLPAREVRGTQQNRTASYLLPLPVIVATYEQIRMDQSIFDYREKFAVVVLDEAQRIKSPVSTTSIACTTIPRQRSWALSGTPLENVTEDLVSIVSFICPGLLVPEMTPAEMKAAMQPYYLRRTKEEVLPELPPIIEQEMQLSLSGEQMQAYQMLWSSRRQITSAGNAKGSTHILGLITQLKKLCNYEPISGESVKLDALKLIVENVFTSGDKLIVFSQFVDTLEWLARNLSMYSPDLYTGQMTGESRERAIDQFCNREGPRLLLMSLRAGGVGLNLQPASTVVLFDRWWNPAVEKQAVQRAHRFGRQRPLHVIKFLVQDSIEQRINEILVEKQVLFDKYVDSSQTDPRRSEVQSILAHLLT